ncbi:hypothetical protein HYT18_05320, partial [Candidatus Microgenomates bacterium]|nr:hypothetical protein [Candidatus Microgenomates bacterium]
MVFLLSLFVTTKEAFAATIFYDVPPPQGAPILSAEQCQAPPECANTAVPGQSNQCGQACPDSGSGAGRSWTKYRLTCVLDPETDRPTGHYQEDDIVCSIADKCQYQPFLQSGRCDCSVGGTYKTCCTGDGNVNGSCVASGTQDNSF